MISHRLALTLLEPEFAIVRLPPVSAVPAWAWADFCSITKTADELSIVCPAAHVPAETKASAGWRCLKAAGPLDFSMVGVLLSLLEPLAKAGLSASAISTYDTDYILVQAAALPTAIEHLKAAGHSVRQPFDEAVQGFLAGDFSRLEPLVETPPDGSPCQVVEWYGAGLFANEPAAMAEAFSCACFNGCVPAVEALLARGLDPSGGAGTGLNAFHWAADRGQLEVVKILLRHHAPLEVRNSYGGTILGCTVYSAVHTMRPQHLAIIEALLAAGADVRAADYPSGDERVDELLRRYGAGA